MSQTTTQPAAQTPAQRIAGMKARAAAKKQREADEKATRERKDRLESQTQAELAAVLEPLSNIPVRPNGAVNVLQTADGDVNVVRVVRKGWTVEEADNEFETLMDFFVLSDPEGSEAWVTHDGDVIAYDVALDLATAAVEARFDG